MKILFFVEPLISRDNPYWQGYFLFHHIDIIINSLGEEEENEFYFALNKALLETIEYTEYKNKIKKIFSFTQKELKKYSFSTLEIEKSFYHETFSNEKMEYYKRVMSDKFDKETFDLIISFSPVPYLKELYPKALVLNYEFGLFSREPFPITFFLDPVGPGGYSYIRKYHKEIIKNINLTEKEEKEFLGFLEKIKNIVLKENPFENKIKELKEKYNYLVLLPLQGSNFYLFDPKKDYRSQFEYLEDILIETSKYNDIGIIVTEHPSEKFLNSENLKYFRKNYPNFIYIDRMEENSGISQLLLPYVDAVINVSSTIGFHTLLWNKKLITLGKTHLLEFSDSDSVSKLEETLKQKVDFSKKIKLLYWIIINYAIPEDYIKNKEWLEKFIKVGIENKNNLSEFYNPIETPEVYYNYFLKKMLNCEDELTLFRKKLSMSLFDNKYVKIWINTGKGYLEKQSYVDQLSEEIEINIPENKIDTVLIRFYGIDKLKFEKLMGKNILGEIVEINSIINKTYLEIEENIFYIDNDNFLEYKVDLKLKKIIIKISDLKYIDKVEMIKEYKKQEEKIKEIEYQKNEEIEGKNREIEEINREYNFKLNQKIEEIKNYKLEKENIINEIINLSSRKPFKLVHFLSRIKNQFILGSLKEKKNFLKWIKRDEKELLNDKYNGLVRILNKIKNKNE